MVPITRSALERTRDGRGNGVCRLRHRVPSQNGEAQLGLLVLKSTFASK